MIQVDLIPDVKQELIKAQRIRSIVITSSILIGSIAIVSVVVLALYVFTIQVVRDNIANEEIKKQAAKMESFEDLTKSLTIQNQLTKISSYNTNKKIYSRAFGMIDSIVPPSPNDVKISDLVIDSESYRVTINGQAERSYAALEVFKKTIEGAVVKYTTGSDTEAQEVELATEISTSNTSYGEDSSGRKVLRFTISFICAKEFFSIDSSSTIISISNQGNATDSYLGIPRSIFADRAKDLESEVSP